MDWLQDSRLQDFLSLFGDNPPLRALVLVVVSLLAAKIADAVFSRVLKLWAKKSKTDLDDQLLEILHRPVFVSIVLIGLWLATPQLALPQVYHRTVLRLLKTVGLWVWVVFALRATTLTLDALSRMKSRLPAIDIRTLPLFENTAKIIIAGTAIYLLFLSWGIEVGLWLMSAVFNVGDTSENYQKRMIVEEVKRTIPNAKIKYVQKDEDPRDYRVSFEKIKNELGFTITKRVSDGIREIKEVIDNKTFINLDDPKYSNS